VGNRRDAFRVLVEGCRGRDRLENPEVDGRIIFKWVFQKWDVGLDWNNLAHYRDRWWSLVNVAVNLRFP
jgi:hypothetical protein